MSLGWKAARSEIVSIKHLTIVEQQLTGAVHMHYTPLLSAVIQGHIPYCIIFMLATVNSICHSLLITH